MESSHESSIQQYLHELWDRGGTDLLLTAGAPPLVRVDGSLRPLEDEPVLRPADAKRLIQELLSAKQVAMLFKERELDFSFGWEGMARIRGNAFFQRDTPALALRLIPEAIPTFADLELPPIVETFVRLPQGLILVTGPTGSGKSTTLASMVDSINHHRPCHIITIEDPIEYVHRHRVAAVNQREIGSDSYSFDRALRSALREDPEVLLVGEMRDLDSIAITLTMAETGHLVFSTLHTNDAAQALDRIVDVFPADRQAQVRVELASSLAGIISQRLLPKVGGGRVAAYEVLVATNAIRNLIREGKTRQLRNIVATSQHEGMQTLETSLSELVARGLITYEDAVAVSVFPHEIRLPVRQGQNGRRQGRRARSRTGP